jgi:PAS domain S-box-containing protein
MPEQILILGLITLAFFASGLAIWHRQRGYTHSRCATCRREPDNSEAILNNVAANVPGIIFQYRLYPNGRSAFPYVSKANIALVGLSQEDVREDSTPFFSDRLHPDDYEKITASLRASYESGEPWHDVFRVIVPGRGEQWMEGWATPERLEDGGALWHGFATDVTEPKKIEDALRENEQRYRRLFETAHDAILIADDTNQYIDANPAACDLLGYSRDELLTLGPAQIITQAEPEQIEHLWHTFLDEKIQSGEIVLRHRDGRIIYAEYRAVAQFLPGQHFSIMRDITERKQQEQALREAQRRRQALFEQSNDAVFLLGLDGRHLEANQRAADLFGYNLDELMTLSLKDLSAESEKSEDVRQRLLAGERLPTYERLLRRKDGSVFPVEINVELVCDGNGRPLYIQSIMRDITKRKLAELDLRQSHEELKNALSALKETQDHLIQRERLASLGELAAGVAHELNNPLTSILLHAQLLQLHNINPDIAEDVAQIAAQSQRAGSIVRSLLDFSRQQPIQKQPIQINNVLRSATQFMAHELRMRNFTVEWRLEPQLPLVLGDAQQLQQVFVNLLNNAVQSNPKNRPGRIILSSALVTPRYQNDTLASGQAIRVSVKDNGQGIQKELQGRIFDPFFTTKPIGKGTGLGLSVCHGIVTEHNGHIWVKSVLGEGATFFVEMPIAAVEMEEEAPGVGASGDAAPRTGGSAAPLPRVLLVDDEESIRQATPRILGQFYDVDLAANGEEALAKATTAVYHLIICDIYMPEMGGIEFYNQWQQQQPDRANTTPILFISGDTVTPYLKTEIERLNAAFLPKPFDTDRLLHTAHTLIARKNA